MNFEWNQASYIDGELVYRQTEYSIDFKVASSDLLAERIGSASSTSLSLTTLQIEVGIENGELLYPWGLFPKARWHTRTLSAPNLQPGRVCLVQGGEKLQVGVSVLIPGSSSWPIVWDKDTGWICVGNDSSNQDATAVEFSKNAAVVLAGGELVSLWLRPKMAS